jgi:hypothetical protein
VHGNVPGMGLLYLMRYFQRAHIYMSCCTSLRVSHVLFVSCHAFVDHLFILHILGSRRNSLLFGKILVMKMWAGLSHGQ